MNFFALSIATIGCISAVISCSINAYLLYVIAPWQMTKKKKDLSIFYFRFLIDVFQGFTVALYLGFVIIYGFSRDEFEPYNSFVFYLSLPSSNLGAMRSILTLAITIERNLAAYTPIMFHNFRRRFPVSIVFLIAIAYGLFEDVVLCNICSFELQMPKGCFAFGCAINECFRSYWTSSKSLVFAVTALSSLTLCLKLFILNNCGEGTKSSDISRANRLALLDAGIAFVFSFLPSFIANRTTQQSFFSFENIGPYGAVTQILGYAIESYLVSKSLLKKKKFVGESNKSTNKSHLLPAKMRSSR